MVTSEHLSYSVRTFAFGTNDGEHLLSALLLSNKQAEWDHAMSRPKAIKNKKCETQAKVTSTKSGRLTNAFN
jgi:hypothetical protein